MSIFSNHKYLEKIVPEYNKTDWRALLREDLGEHHLKELELHLDSIKYGIDDIINVLTKINYKGRFEINYEMQFENYQQTLIDLLTEFSKITNTIRQHQPIPDTTHEHSEIIRIVMNLRASIWHNCILILRDLRSINMSTYKLKKDDLDTTKATEELSEAREAISQHAAKSSLERGVTRYRESFEKEAKKNETASQFYGIALFLFATVACGIAFFLFSFNDNIKIENISELLIKGNILNKIFIFTILLLLVSVLKTNHLSLKHQYSLNKHRQNALDSYQDILHSIQKTASESNKETSNAIVLELTKAVFLPQETGFIKNQKDSSSGNQIVDILNSTSKK